jgi:uncharacterized membrane protein YadS
VNDTSSVVAAAYAYGPAAGALAVVVKLTRTTHDHSARRRARHRAPPTWGKSVTIRWRSIAPWFLLWFLAAAGLNTAGAFPTHLVDTLREASIALITAALAAVGLNTRTRTLREAGPRPCFRGRSCG